MRHTDRLLLRMFVPGDAARLLEILSAPGVLDYFPPSPAPTQDSANRMIERVRREWADRGYCVWAVEHDGELIGRAGLQYLEETDETEVDFMLHPDFWGRGFATEVGRSSVQFGLEELGLDRIIGLVHPDNIGSHRVLEKIGMRLERRAAYFGMVVDKYVVLR